jgi:asparagine synthetase B (glutamine-hydrolysing)
MMAYGIEGRVPYLVAPVVVEANRWTWEQRTAGLGKAPLRAVARRWLPPAICDRPKSPFASGVRARPDAILGLLKRHRERLLEIVTPGCLAECVRTPQHPQSWKLAALGLYLDTHGLHVGAQH